jgi:hypothetical protein
MSAIAISFDGLVLLLALAMGAVGYGLIAVIAVIRAMAHPEDATGATWRLALRAGVMSLATLLCFVPLLAWWAGTSTALRPGFQLDYLTWPWLAIFGLGCLALTRDPRA